MEINRLLSDELSFELFVRNAPVEGTVVEKRQRLRGLMRLEKMGLSQYYNVDINFGDELETCTGKIQELCTEVDNFDNNNATNENQRIQSRIVHVLGRLNRITGELHQLEKSRLIARCAELMSELENRMAALEPVSVATISLIDQPNELLPTVIHQPSRNAGPSRSPEAEIVRTTPLSVIDNPNSNDMISFSQRPRTDPIRINQSRFGQSLRSPNNANNVNTRSQGVVSSNRDPESPRRRVGFANPPLSPIATSVPQLQSCSSPTGVTSSAGTAIQSKSFNTISNWGVRFNGFGSVTNFLESVEELKIACGISDSQLLTSAVVLFSDVAVIWYRAVRDSITSWQELKDRLRMEFLSPEYDEDIWSDIRTRTQGEQEKTAIFVAVMENLFKKLSKKPDESERLRIIRRNLLPYLQQQLALVEMASIADLCQRARQIEGVKTRTDRLHAPPTNRNAVTEPQLMYHRPPSTRVSAVNTVPFQGRCFNCNETGHVQQSCPKPRNRHCFSCGEPGVTKFSCPRCTRAGNGPPGH